MLMIKSKLALLSVLVFAGAGAGLVFAQQTDVTNNFRQQITVPTQAVLVPTVIELSLPDISGFKKEFLVVETQTGNYLPSYYFEKYTKTPVSLTAVTDAGQSVNQIVDADRRTQENFSLPESGNGEVTLVVTGAESFKSSSFVLDLAQNVSLPYSIEVKATLNDGTEEIVVAEKRPRSSRVQFPETEAREWQITMKYIQPLRISDIRFMQTDVESSVERKLRFLIKPEMSYKVFLDPERVVNVDTIEGGDLTEDDDVLQLSEISQLKNNPDFVFSDVDGDKIPDVLDNCVDVANADQMDVDRNSRGDACDDYDRDGFINSVDNCPDDANRSQADEDGDGIGDACDQEESRVTEKHQWIPWLGIGIAVAVFVVMFWLMSRRLKDEVNDQQQESSTKTNNEFSGISPEVQNDSVADSADGSAD